MTEASKEANWGLLPIQVKQLIRRREWDNAITLKARLSGQKPFPIRIGLKPPSGRMAITNMPHFQDFIAKWRTFPTQKLVQWETQTFRNLSEQSIPKFLVLENVQELTDFVGAEAVRQSKIWSQHMSPLLQLDQNLYPVLIKHLELIEKITLSDAKLLAILIPQLLPNMGNGCYLRALPLIGADTKFLENHATLIADILDKLHDGAVSSMGGVLSWLGCQLNPKGWLTVRSLCHTATDRMGGFPIVQITGEMLKHHELPASNILVVENLQSGLGLPDMEDTIAVIGGGKNTLWMEADWLKNKRTAYWGDIDTWGLSILSDVRSHIAQVESLMMDIDTLKLHEERMVNEAKSVERHPENLTEAEVQLFDSLKLGVFNGSRLEQERLSSDYINKKIKDWVLNLKS